MLDDTFACDPQVERSALLAEQTRLRTEVTNITTAIAQGGDIPALADALKQRDSRLRAIAAELTKPVTTQDRRVLKADLELRSANWREVLRGPHLAQVRLVLQHLIELPIKIHNKPKPKWLVATRPFGLGVGLIQNLASPPGFEPGF